MDGPAIQNTPASPEDRWVIGVTGASGARYALRLIEILIYSNYSVDVVFSEAALRVLREEEDLKLSRANISIEALGISQRGPGKVRFHHPADIGAEIASGSCLFNGMVVVPCSMSTLGAIAHGIHSHLIHRVADVVLKEHRKLILVPRETPLSTIHLRNLLTAAEAGAVILPAMPGFYHRPTSIAQLTDMLVMKILDTMGIHIDVVDRWKSDREHL